MDLAIITAIVTGGIALITAIIKHYSSLSSERELKKSALKQKTYEVFMEKMGSEVNRQEEIYRETLAIAKVLAFNDKFDSVTFREAEDRFWELYWAVLPMFETPEVTTAMVHFGDLLQAKEGNAHYKNEARVHLLHLGQSIGQSSPVGAFTNKIIRSVKED